MEFVNTAEDVVAMGARRADPHKRVLQSLPSCQSLVSSSPWSKLRIKYEYVGLDPTDAATRVRRLQLGAFCWRDCDSPLFFLFSALMMGSTTLMARIPIPLGAG